MLALGRLRGHRAPCLRSLCRRESTAVEKSSTVLSNRDPAGTKITRRTSRPNISLAHPRKWNRPIARGVLPVYDEALKLIKRDATQLKAEAESLKDFICESENAPERDESKLRAIREKLNVLEVQSEINLPDVRWKCANGLADLSNPAHRHLLEQRWRDEGTLDLLMERLHQMHFIPDVLPVLHPSLDLRITFPIVPSQHAPRRQRIRPRYKEVEPGVYLSPEQTRNPPKLYANVFHTDTRLYTLLMVDPDAPDEVNESYQTYLHWLQPNIPLSTNSPRQILAHSHTPYIPPHPQRGTPYHRYVTLLLLQSHELSIPVISDDARLGFDVREFMREHSLDGNLGGGAHMWREVWNAEVSEIYKHILKCDEPKYGRPPKPDQYAEVKRTRRYV